MGHKGPTVKRTAGLRPRISYATSQAGMFCSDLTVIQRDGERDNVREYARTSLRTLSQSPKGGLDNLNVTASGVYRDGNTGRDFHD